MYLVSVIIPTYNRGHCIKQAIDSVLNQSYSNLEVLVVDDGSTDCTQSVLKQYNDTRLHILYTNERKGACSARNLGISQARGEYIAFHDSDDIWLVHKLEMLLEAMLSNDIDVGFSSLMQTDELSHKALKFPNIKLSSKTVMRHNEWMEALLRRNLMSTQTIIIKRGCVEKIGGFDENLTRFQDWEFAIRLLKAYNIIYLPEPLVVARIQNDSITKNFTNGIKSRIFIYKKHATDFNKFPNAKIFFLKDALIRAAISKNIELIKATLKCLLI